MALLDTYYKESRLRAKFHLQVEIESITIKSLPGAAPVNAKVRQVFRGGEWIKIGDLVQFDIHVYSEIDSLPCGGILWTHRDAAEKARYMEVFLDGEPPSLEVARWQSFTIENISDAPKFEVPTEEELRLEFDSLYPKSLLSRFLLLFKSWKAP